MAVVLPFRGLRYDQDRAGLIDTLVAPPYDVVTQEEREWLIAQNPYNIFSLELPHGNEDRYERAKHLFNAWMTDGILKKEDAPAIYPYQIEFHLKGKVLSRLGFVALVKIEEWGSRIIRPHEKTFDRVTEDRYRLLSATRAQFSQIFVIYRHNEPVSSLLSLYIEKSEDGPVCAARDRAGNNHRLWRITDKDAIKGIHDALIDQPLYIADGHHRYTTALKYKKDMNARLGGDPAMPFNYLMAYLVDAEDPGLAILPTHRMVTLDTEGFDRLNRLSSTFETKKIEADGNGLCQRLEAALAKGSDIPSFGVVLDHGKRAEIWQLKDEAAKDLPPHKRFDVLVLEETILKALPCRSIAYSSECKEALKGLGQDQVLFLLRPTPIDKVLDIADRGLTMPHKSTFFYPKILTGLVVNQAGEDGRIEPL
ncbi:DUF1015 domain-containing protein [Dissulfurimicrobium hydrothermale]|uniref:DUF1015 domain-containing protein n=1 Tax=Dissulfurimicrobium hydrothermale TaxID=1750598 RepID=UPI001EDA025B|nr:DUF1015 domain-containing protein [Dissulfurimicrobium hydrothermale]UKL14159.1 DUF1015 domain-containing protein [Dissulfurimicrobium hydrothermale]